MKPARVAGDITLPGVTRPDGFDREPWGRERSLTPVPSPARAEEGCRRRVRAAFPRAGALGYDISPLTGLCNTLQKRDHFIHEFLRH
jgi:hypothetical protein